MTITSTTTLTLRGDTTLRVHHFDQGRLMLALHADSCSANIHLTPEQARALSDALRPAEVSAQWLLQLGTHVLGKPAHIPFDREASGVIAEVDRGDTRLPYRVLFDGWRRPLWCRAADVRALEGEGA